MKAVLSFILIFNLFSLVVAQQSADNLKKEEKKLEKKITQTKSLLKKVQNNSKASLNEVRLLDNQIKSRESLVQIFDNQIRLAEMKMAQKRNDISRLQKKLKALKLQYKKMLFFAYKKRNNTGKLMFLLSAKSYNEALKRNAYLKKVADMQRRQSLIIKQHQDLINKEIRAIDLEKEDKIDIMNEKKEEKNKIEGDKKLKEGVYSKLKREEEGLMTQLKEDEKKRKKIEGQIQAAIQAEIKREEEKRKQIEREKEKAAAKAKADAAKAKPDASGKKPEEPAPVNTVEPKPTYKPETISTEGSITGKSFEANKGKMPSPVIGGSITSKYGRNAHPTFKDVYENNNGIDITCTAGSKVRAVFEGEVSSVFSIAGAGTVVIIKHGSYRSVYSNLASASVSVGSKITAKQNIGSLLIGEGVSVLHFEIHAVSGMITTPLNPSLWISR